VGDLADQKMPAALNEEGGCERREIWNTAAYTQRRSERDGQTVRRDPAGKNSVKVEKGNRQAKKEKEG